MKMRHLVVATSAALLSYGAIAGGQQQSQSREPQSQDQALRDASIVREAQQSLRAKGYAATPDGLKEFQQAQGIAPSGKLDQQTLAALGVNGSAASGASSGTAPQRGEKPKD